MSNAIQARLIGNRYKDLNSLPSRESSISTAPLSLRSEIAGNFVQARYDKVGREIDNPIGPVAPADAVSKSLSSQYVPPVRRYEKHVFRRQAQYLHA